MKKFNFDFIKNSKRYFAFSLALIVFIIAFSFIFGVEMDIQFKGGALINYSYVGDFDATQITDTVTGVLGSGVSVQDGSAVGDDLNSATVTLPGAQTVTAEKLEELTVALEETYPEQEFTLLEVNNVNATIGKEFFAKSIVAVAVAFILILLYIAFRFRNIGGWPAGSMALVALVHDLIVIYGVFVVMRTPLNGNFIAAVLMILGYSINDTVVIYDRIRENRTLEGKKVPFAQIVNKSINQSLVRSVNTTVSTLLALGTVCVVSKIYGLDSIFTFAFPLMIGMVSGVYSTVCIAGPLWVKWEERKADKAENV